MTRLFLAAGVAALAIAAPAASDPGKKGDKGQAAQVDRGGGKGQARAERQNQRVAQETRGNDRREARVERRADRADNRTVRLEQRRERTENRAVKLEQRGRGRDDARIVKLEQRERKLDDRLDRRELRAAGRDLRGNDLARLRDPDNWIVPGRGGPIVNGCPPGLMNKAVPCVPPGQVKNMIGQRLDAAYQNRLLPLGLRDLYRDDDDYFYRLGNGYVYRVDRDTSLVNSLLPLIGAGLGVGQMFPSSYMNSYVPSYYQSFYPDGQDDYYRYANGYVYEIDRDSGYIEDMIPLMAGGYGVGQMLPAGYSAYNVPYQYRDLYYDTPDAHYRYAPGAIYQVDPTTQLITSVASLLSPSAFGVGQQLPMGYGTYNVPLAYRDQYYDTPDSWYRYNNGSIYQVDPTTQLITAVIRALV